ncbi:MAG: GC-type dockerin domain-anchored protein [Phycisphaerales bacterium]
MNRVALVALPAVLIASGLCPAQSVFSYTVDGRRCSAFFSGNGSGSSYEVPHVPFGLYEGGAEIDVQNGIESWHSRCTQVSAMDSMSMAFSGAGDAQVSGAGVNTLNAQATSLFEIRFSCADPTPYRLAGFVAESGHPASYGDVRLATAAGVTLHSVVSSTDESTAFDLAGTLPAGSYVVTARAQPRAVAPGGQSAQGSAACVVTLSIPTQVQCRLDWNGDSMVDSTDFLDFVSDFLSGQADYNADGITDSADFFLFLTQFLGGC